MVLCDVNSWRFVDDLPASGPASTLDYRHETLMCIPGHVTNQYGLLGIG